jgi:transposase InsO family protein
MSRADLVGGPDLPIGNLKDIGKVWQFTACDAACSYAVAWLTTELSARSARHFLLRYLLPLYRRAGHALRAILTDGGSEYRGVFHQACAALGIEHRRTQPRHAWTNGFVERLQGTILTELWRCAFRRTYYTAVAPMQHDLDQYLRFYNFECSHQGYRLHGHTPAGVCYATA